MKKILAFTVFLFLSLELFALKNVEISFSPETGIVNGGVKEYVLLNNVTDELYTLSRLDWDLKPVYFFGLNNNYVFKDKVFFGLSGKYGIPGHSGKMIDNDWMNYPYFPDYVYQTNYSEHDCYLNHYLNGKISLGYIYKKSDYIKICPRISFQYQDIFFEGKHGFLLYGKLKQNIYYPYDDENSSHVEITDFSKRERVITYRQVQFIPFIGIDFLFEWKSGFGLSFLTEISPIAFILANDKHYSTDSYVGITNDGKYYRDFLDRTHGIGTCNLEINTFYKINRTNRFDIILTCLYTPQLKGPSGMRNTATNKFVFADATTIGGYSMQFFSTSISYTLSF